MRRRAVTSLVSMIVSTGALVAGCVVLAPTASAEPMSGGIDSCAELWADYPGGIAKTARAARRVAAKGYRRPIVCRRVYVQVQDALDPNRNRVACERR